MKFIDHLFFTLLFFLTVTQASSQNSLPSIFQAFGISGGGYTYSPSINPKNPNEIFLVCDMGGLYKSNDQGRTWNMLPSSEIISSVKGKVQFTENSAELYVVGRSTKKDTDPWFKGGIFKSVDSGITWEQIPDPCETGVHKLLVDPNNSMRMLVNEYDKLFFTGNGGQNWIEIFSPANQQVWLAGAVWNDNQIIVGTDHGLLVSNDSGVNFNLESHSGLPNNTGIMQLSGAMVGSTLALYCIPVEQSELFAWNEPLSFKDKVQGCFKMNYSPGANWLDAKSNIPADVIITDVVCNSSQAELIYASGSINNSVPVVYKSSNSAQSWESIFKAFDNENIKTGWGGDGFGIFSYLWSGSFLGFDVSDSNPEVVIGVDGMGHISRNGGENWEAIYVAENDLNEVGTPTQLDKLYQSSGLNVTTTHQLYFNGPNEILAANTDIGLTFSPDKGNYWSFERNLLHPWGSLASNNWYRIVKNSNTGDMYAAIANINDIYLSYRISDESIEPGGKVLESKDNGVIWDTLHDFGYAVVWLEIDKSNSKIMYASVVDYEEGGIYKTSDAGISWTKLNAPPRTEGHPYNIVSLTDGGLLVSYSARAIPGSSNLTESSGVFYSSDGGLSWSDRTDPKMKFYTKDIVLDPNDPTENTWYTAVWGRYSVWPGNNNDDNGGLYKTVDRGLNWQRVFKNESVESLSFDPNDPKLLLVTCENDGLYYSGNIQDANPIFSKLEQFPFWRPKRVFFNPFDQDEIWVTSMGGGLFMGKKEISTIDKDIQIEQSVVDIFPNPISKAGNYIQIKSNSSSSLIHQLILTDINGREIESWQLDQKAGEVKLQLKNIVSGVYVLHIEMENGIIHTKRLIKI